VQITLAREMLLPKLRYLAGIVERKSSHFNPILAHILMETRGRELFLTATDNDIQLRCKLTMDVAPAESVKLIITFRKFYEILRALPAKAEVTLTAEDKRILLRAGRSRFSLTALQMDDFPLMTEPDNCFTFNLTKKDLSMLIEATAYAMAEQDVRYYLNGMLLDIKHGNIFAVAADGHRLAVNKAKTTIGNNINTQIIVPRKAIIELQRLLGKTEEEVQIYISENILMVCSEDFKLLARLLEGQFPPYDRVIPADEDRVIVSDRLQLKSVFNRASALFTDKFRGIRLRFFPGSMKVLANTKESDEVEEDIDIKYKGEKFDVGFNVGYLLDSLNTLTAEKIKLTFANANGTALLEDLSDEGGKHIIMPLRLPGD